MLLAPHAGTGIAADAALPLSGQFRFVIGTGESGVSVCRYILLVPASDVCSLRIDDWGGTGDMHHAISASGQPALASVTNREMGSGDDLECSCLQNAAKGETAPRSRFLVAPGLGVQVGPRVLAVGEMAKAIRCFLSPGASSHGSTSSCGFDDDPPTVRF